MQTKKLLQNVLRDLEDLKAVNVVTLDVRKLTSITDFMVIASGNSRKHVSAIVDNLVHNMKTRSIYPAVEGDANEEWLLVDLGDVVVHIMQTKTREFYNLEKLWSPAHNPRKAALP